MAAAPALSFDIESNVTSFSRAMALVESAAKQKAASFALEFTGAGKKAEDALGGFAKRSAVQIGDSLSSAAKRYEVDFAKATQGVGTNITKGIGEALKPGLFSAGALVAGVATVAIGFATVAAAISQANAQIDRFIKLGANAESAGVSVDFFQRFSEAAKQAKIDVGDIEAALKRAGSVVTPKFEQDDPIRTRLNEVFETGYTGSYQSKGLADYNAAGTNEQRIRAAVTAMQELHDLGLQTAAIEIGDKLFGPEVADRIRTGRLEIDAIAASLDKPRDDLITQQQVEQAQEFRDRLDAAYKTIDDFFHVSVALEGSGRVVLDTWLLIAEAVAKGATNVSSFYDKVQAAQGVLGNLLSTTASLVVGFSKMGAENINDKVAGTRTIYDKPIGPEKPGAPDNAIINPPAPPRRALELFTSPPKTGAGATKAAKSPATPSETLDQVQTYVNGIERSTEALKAEADAIGKSAIERQTGINVARLEAIARQQGITLTAEQIAKVKDLSKATVEYRDAIEDARERQEALRSIGGDVLKGIASDARNGASALDILTSAVGRLADRMSDRALDSLADSLFGKSGGKDGSGILGGLFGGGGAAGEAVKGLNLGSLFGLNPLPTFAAGVTSAGIIEGPGTGTSDSILARVSKGESIVTAKATAQNRPIIEAMNAGRKVPSFSAPARLPAFAGGRVPTLSLPPVKLPGFAAGHLPDPGEFSAGLRAEEARAASGTSTAPRLSPAAADRAAVGMTTEVNVIGGEKTSAKTEMGPRGPRTTVSLDKAVAGMLLNGSNTRSALKQIGSGRLTGR